MSAWRVIRFAAIALGVFALGYLVGAFMAWELNPGEWDAAARSMGGVLFAAMGLGVATVVDLESRP